MSEQSVAKPTGLWGSSAAPPHPAPVKALGPVPGPVDAEPVRELTPREPNGAGVPRE